jgi:hypothetical protein
MRRVAGVLLLLLAAAGCDRGGPIEGDDVALRVSAPPAEVELGQGFPLTVVRVWSKDLEPDPWRDAALLPLAVRLEETTHREDSSRIEETRRFHAHAFEPGTVTVAPFSFAAAPKAGGAARTAAAEGFSVKVRATLDPKSAGPPELPGLLPEPVRWRLWTLVAATALAAGALLVRVGTRRSAAAALAAAAPPGARARALERIGRLRTSRPATPEEVGAWHVEAASLVRDFVADDRALRSRERTTEELLEAARATGTFPESQREALAAALEACDLVKFARDPSSAAGRERVLAAAEAVVTGTGRPA